MPLVFLEPKFYGVKFLPEDPLFFCLSREDTFEKVRTWSFVDVRVTLADVIKVKK